MTNLTEKVNHFKGLKLEIKQEINKSTATVNIVDDKIILKIIINIRLIKI